MRPANPSGRRERHRTQKLAVPIVSAGNAGPHAPCPTSVGHTALQRACCNGPLIRHLQMLIEVTGRKRNAQPMTTYGLQSAAGYGRIHAEPWMTAGKTARAPGTPQYQAASDIARPSVVIAGWPPCPEPERFLSRRRRTTLGGIRAISDADEHPARAGHLHFNPPRTEDWQPCKRTDTSAAQTARLACHVRRRL